MTTNGVTTETGGYDELLEALRTGRTSCRRHVEERLRRIEEGGLGTFVHLRSEAVLAEAEESDRRFDEGCPRPLEGLTVGLKDLFAQRGEPLECASAALRGFVAPYEATVVSRLIGAGALILGRNNMDEFAMGSSSETGASGSVFNPLDRRRVAGGSSGGGAAAVAAGEVLAALGTDTGGSVRQPASFTGIVGLKPTYGRISRYGMTAFASSLDHCGILTRRVRDAARLLSVLAGADSLDSTCVDRPAGDYLDGIDNGLRGLRVAVPREYLPPNLDRGIRDSIERAAGILQGEGAEVVEGGLPHTAYALPAYCILAMAEASSNLSHYDGIRYGPGTAGLESPGEEGVPEDRAGAHYRRARGTAFGVEVKRRIMLGSFVLSAGYAERYYRRAQCVRRLVAGDFARLFKDAQLLLCPTSPEAPFELGAKLDDPLSMYASDLLTVGANLAGIPALSLPGHSLEGPFRSGIQLMAPHFAEAPLLRAARTLERRLEHERA